MMMPASMHMKLAEENGYTFVHPFDDLDSRNRSGNDCDGDRSGAAYRRLYSGAGWRRRIWSQVYPRLRRC